MFRKVNFVLTDNEIEGIVDCQDLAIEKFLLRLKLFVEKSTEQLLEVKPKIEVLTVKQKFEQIKSHKVTESNVEEDSSPKGKLVKDLKNTISLLEEKITKMENSVKTKDEKIRFLSKKLQSDKDIDVA